MGSLFGVLAGMSLLAVFVVIGVGLLIAALLLTLSFRWVVGYMPSLLRAFGAVLLTAIASAVALGMARAVGGDGRLLGLAVQFLIGAGMVNLLLLGGDGLRIGFAKASLVQLVYTGLCIIAGLVLGLALVALFGGMLASMHG